MTAPGGKLASVTATASFPDLSRLGRAVASDSVVMCARLHAECASTPPSDARSDFPPGAYSLIVSIGRFVPSRPQWDECSISHFRESVNSERVIAANTTENEGELNHHATHPVCGESPYDSGANLGIIQEVERHQEAVPKGPLPTELKNESRWLLERSGMCLAGAGKTLSLKTAVGGECFSRRGAERQRMQRKLQICSFIAVTRTICCFTL